MNTTTENAAAATLQATENTTTTAAATNRRRVKVEQATDTAPLGMVRIFSKGIGDNHAAATMFFQERAANDGYTVRRLGGQAPSAYTSTRGAAGALNVAFLNAAHHGVTVADLLNVTAAACLGKGGVTGNPYDKLVAHMKSFHLQADSKRAAANGLVKAIIANGWNWNEVQRNAVLLDGKPWDGQLFKRSVTPSTIVLPVVLLALHFKATPSFRKALGLTD
jgi:hypothetical protein